MIVNKKLDRFKQWAGERMGGEVRTNLSEEFIALEAETTLRQEGLDKIHKSMANYTKSISKRAEGEHREKQLPIAHLGVSMIQHGAEFEHDSHFGQCISSFGHTQEQLSQIQEAYITAATNTWLESLERSLGQMKEWQMARKKLESRRLAYDTSLAKMQKAKKEDFRVEEELRSHKLKYEETEDDVYRRMLDVKDAEVENAADLSDFLDAQLAYHAKCQEALLRLKNEWPAGRQASPAHTRQRPSIRSRSNTARSIVSSNSSSDLEYGTDSRSVATSSRKASDLLDPPAEYNTRPGFLRSTTFDSQSRVHRDLSPVPPGTLNRVPSDSMMGQGARTGTQYVPRIHTDVVREVVALHHSNVHSPSDRSRSPASVYASGSTTPLGMKKRAPPPPPPSRSTKPALPPLPVKRTLMI